MSRTVKTYDPAAGSWIIPEPDSIQLMQIDGVMYVSVDDESDLSQVAEELDLADADLSNTDLLHQLRSQSMPCRILNSNTGMMIREKYSVDDEIQALREDDESYRSFVASVVSDAAEQKDVLGLVTPE